jgi:glutaconyl-CoA/methylmalonyl-CoA decarboxylase subunit gamma
MKYRIKIDEQIYEVDIQDLNARPVKATVDGVAVEVWPENGAAAAEPSKKRELPAGPAASPVQAGAPAGDTGIDPASVRAPIPGVIVAIKVKAGDEVAYGAELITLEAMKMRNAIRAVRAGKVAEVLVETGQTVNHGDVLLRFEG